MKKVLGLLLTTSALLMACGAEEPEATEDIANESATDADNEAEQQVAEPTTENVKDTSDEIDYGEVGDEEYFSIHYHQGNVEVENKMEDASDISGLYQVTLPDEYKSYRYFPQETFIDIREDGRATVLSYEVADITYDAETGSIVDENVLAYIEEADETENTEDTVDTYMQSINDSFRNMNENYVSENRAQFMYVDEQNNLNFAEGPVPFRIEMASGYMVQEYGQIEFVKVEQAEVHPYLNENGEPALSSNLNSVSTFVRRDNKWVGEGLENYLISPLEFSLETASLDEVNFDAIRLPFVPHSEGLRSVNQVWYLLSDDNNERTDMVLEEEAFLKDPSQPYITNQSEMLHFIRRNGLGGALEIADNPSEYSGYAQDNVEIVPDVVFVNESGRAATLREDGTVWMYNKDNGTWDRVENSRYF